MTQLERSQKYRIKNRDKINARNALRDTEKIAIRVKEMTKEDPRGYLLRIARRRAKSNGREISISKNDIIIPTHCPYFPWLKLITLNEKAPAPGSMSIDRIDNTKGYTPDNIEVISYRANVLKRDGTIEEFKALINRMEKL